MDVSRAGDQLAIEALQRRFAELNDAARWHEVAALFVDDGRFVRPTDPERPIVGREAILQAFLARPAGPARRHLVANPAVVFLGDDTARAECHSILIVDLGDGRGTVTVGGFRDELRREPQGWRFVSRAGFTTIAPAPCTLPPAATCSPLAAPAAPPASQPSS